MTLVELLVKNNHYYEHVFRQNTTDKELRHSYCSLFYDEHFLPYKHKEINLLEIGICHGGSLILWNDYFEKSKIFGVDIVDMTQGSTKPYERINTYFEDAYQDEFISKLPPLDIVIDDGPHTIESQLLCIDVYCPKINPGGMLIIEDIIDINNGNRLAEKANSLGYKHQLFDSTEVTGNHDNIILAIWI
jgi:hypothetical protein